MPTKKRDLGISPEAIARESHEEKKDQKCAEMEGDIAFLKSEIKLLKTRVSVLEASEN